LSLNLLFCLLSNFNLKEQSIVKDAWKSYKDSNYKILLEDINTCLKIYYESLNDHFIESSFSNRNKQKSNLQDNKADTILNLTKILYDFIHRLIEKLIIIQKINDLNVKKKLFECNIDKFIITNKLNEKFEISKMFPNFPIKASDIYLEAHSNDIIKFIESQIDKKIKDLSKEFLAMR
jgi:hypothetical protein